MYIEAKKRGNRNESIMVFNFTSVKNDFEPYIEELERHTSNFSDEDYRKWWLELVDKIKSRCDDKYAKGDVILSSCLFADEAALFMHLASYLLIVL